MVSDYAYLNDPTKERTPGTLFPSKEALIKAKAVLLAAVFLLAWTGEAAAHNDRFDRMSYGQLVKAANRAIANGHSYSHRWGDASAYLRGLCYELVERTFKPYGTERWALYVVRRESGCNPRAINSSSQTTGIAQIHPTYHTWINYRKVQYDMHYAMQTFLRLSRGGRNTGPWCLC